MAIAGKLVTIAEMLMLLLVLLGKKGACRSRLVGGGADSSRMRNDKSWVKALTGEAGAKQRLASLHCLLILHPRPKNSKQLEPNKLDLLCSVSFSERFFKLHIHFLLTVKIVIQLTYAACHDM